MTVTLRIDNIDSLPDGGPLSFSVRGRGFEIGRESHLDWSLPDPNRVISGRHCEVRYDNGAYWLNDVSRNGTFLNGSSARVKSPYRLNDGDRIQIGHYLISVKIAAEGQADPFGAGEAAASGGFGAPVQGGDGIWDTGAPAPAPIARRDLMPPPKQGRREADFAEQYLDIPDFRPASGGDPFAAPPSAPPQVSPFAAPPPAAAPRPGTNPFAQPPAPRPAAFEQTPPDQGFGAPPAPLPPAPIPFQGESEPFAPLRTPSQPMPLPMAPVPAAPPPPYQQPAPPSAYQQPSPPSYEPQPGYAPQAAPQPTAYAPPPLREAPAYSPAPAGGVDVIARIAAGAGVPPEIFRQRDAGEVADEIGTIIRLVVEELAQLLKARAAAKVMAKSANRTMISAVDNNPLKFMPRPEEVLEIMFARRRQGYLDARRSIEESFKDLKTHEFATYAAMQKALARLLEDLSPEAIDKKVSGSAFASRKARAWDTFVATWEAKSDAGENGMLDVFLAHFADAYEKASKKG